MTLYTCVRDYQGRMAGAWGLLTFPQAFSSDSMHASAAEVLYIDSLLGL